MYMFFYSEISYLINLGHDRKYQNRVLNLVQERDVCETPWHNDMGSLRSQTQKVTGSRSQTQGHRVKVNNLMSSDF